MVRQAFGDQHALKLVWDGAGGRAKHWECLSTWRRATTQKKMSGLAVYSQVLQPVPTSAQGFFCGVKHFHCKLHFRPLLASLVSFRNVARSNITSCTLWNVSNHGRSVFFISENSCCHFNSLKDNWRSLTKSIMGDRRWTMAAVVPNSMAIFTIIVTKAVLHIFVCLWISLANYESEKGNNEIWTLCWAPLMNYVLTIPQLKLLFSVLVWMFPSYLGLFWHKDYEILIPSIWTKLEKVFDPQSSEENR